MSSGNHPGKLHKSYEQFALHSSYEKFVKYQVPKYGKTFIDWFNDNYKVGDIDLLVLLREKIDKTFELDNWTENIVNDKAIIGPTYFTDVFTKKLQLCCNLINFQNYQIKGEHTRTTYGLDKAPIIMELYEDIIFEICTRRNVGVSYLPSGCYSNGVTYTVGWQDFTDFNALMEEISTGEVVIYMLVVLENKSIQCRMAKREPLTRKVLIEKQY